MINRKILASMLVVALVGAVAGSGTLAYFNDTEESTGNTFAAGEIDLQIDWTETYDGPQTVENPVEVQDPTDNPGPVFNLDDVKPGDRGEATLSFHNEGNPYWLWMSTDLPYNNETSVTEPEEDSEDEVNVQGGQFDPNDGELAQNVNVKLWYDDYSNEEDNIQRGDNVHQEGEEEVIIGEVCEQEEPRGNVDIALTIDTSGSMSQTDGDSTTRLEEAQSGSALLLNQLSSSDQSAAVHFPAGQTNPVGDTEQQLTSDHASTEAAINTLSAAGGTPMDAGIEEAYGELTSSRADSSNEQIMVLLADGRPENYNGIDPAVARQDAIDAANTAKQDVTIITVAFGDANNSLMQEIASDDPNRQTFYDANTDNLDTVLEGIGEGTQTCEPATLVDLHDQMEDGQLLDGDTTNNVASPFTLETQYIGFEWWVPSDVGNEIQTDTVEFDLNFYAGQHRHNEDPNSLTNPFAS